MDFKAYGLSLSSSFPIECFQCMRHSSKCITCIISLQVSTVIIIPILKMRQLKRREIRKLVQDNQCNEKVMGASNPDHWAAELSL